MIAFVSTALLVLPVSSSSFQPFSPPGRTMPILLSCLMPVTISSAQSIASCAFLSCSSHIARSGGAYSTGKPARLRSIPIPSISWIRVLKYHDRYAVRRIDRPSGLFFTLVVRKCSAFSSGMVSTPKSGGGICDMPVSTSVPGLYSQRNSVSCARIGILLQPIRPSSYLLEKSGSRLCPFRRL